MKPLDGLRVCLLGRADAEYPRNRIVLRALRDSGADVAVAFDKRALPVRSAAAARTVLSGRFDLVWVAFPGHSDVPAASLAARLKGVPVVFDAFLSIYERKVGDLDSFSPWNPEAAFCWLRDKVSGALADVVLLDTQAHIDYWLSEFGGQPSRFRRLWVGADDAFVRPLPEPGAGAPFTAYCYSSFLPLHGMDQIVRAASLLEKDGEAVRFTLVGSGQTLGAAKKLAAELGSKSVEFTGWAKPEAILEGMAASHLCLGVFGTTGKAGRVIPNKVFDALAAKKAVVTADTPAAREALTHGKDAWLVPAGDPAALAAAVRALKADPERRLALAEAGHRLFKERFSVEVLTQEIAAIVREAVHRA